MVDKDSVSPDIIAARIDVPLRIPTAFPGRGGLAVLPPRRVKSGYTTAILPTYHHA
jgi:hypothetical protein